MSEGTDLALKMWLYTLYRYEEKFNLASKLSKPINGNDL